MEQVLRPNTGRLRTEGRRDGSRVPGPESPEAKPLLFCVSSFGPKKRVCSILARSACIRIHLDDLTRARRPLDRRFAASPVPHARCTRSGPAAMWSIPF